MSPGGYGRALCPSALFCPSARLHGEGAVGRWLGARTKKAPLFFTGHWGMGALCPSALFCPSARLHGEGAVGRWLGARTKTPPFFHRPLGGRPCAGVTSPPLSLDALHHGCRWRG